MKNLTIILTFLGLLIVSCEKPNEVTPIEKYLVTEYNTSVQLGVYSEAVQNVNAVLCYQIDDEEEVAINGNFGVTYWYNLYSNKEFNNNTIKIQVDNLKGTYSSVSRGIFIRVIKYNTQKNESYTTSHVRILDEDLKLGKVLYLHLDEDGIVKYNY